MLNDIISHTWAARAGGQSPLELFILAAQSASRQVRLPDGEVKCFYFCQGDHYKYRSRLPWQGSTLQARHSRLPTCKSSDKSHKLWHLQQKLGGYWCLISLTWCSSASVLFDIIYGSWTICGPKIYFFNSTLCPRGLSVKLSLSFELK